MSSRRTSATIRRNLFKRFEGRCHWCSCETVLEFEGKYPPANFATRDHLKSRLNPARSVPTPSQKRWVLACLGCNQSRNDAEQAALPKQELHRRSGRPEQQAVA